MNKYVVEVVVILVVVRVVNEVEVESPSQSGEEGLKKFFFYLSLGFIIFFYLSLVYLY